MKAHTVGRSSQAWNPRVLPAQGGEREPHASHAEPAAALPAGFAMTRQDQEDKTPESTRRQPPALPPPSTSQKARGPHRPASAAPTASEGKQVEQL